MATLGPLAKAKYEAERLTYPKKAGVYLTDFTLGNNIILEVKGYFKAADRTKMLAVRAAHPGRDIRFVLQTPYATLNKTSDTTYAQWCEKHDFLWCASTDVETLTKWSKEK